MTELTLFSMPSSGNSYKARLLLSLLGLSYKHVGMEYDTPEIAEAHAKGILPLGRLPVLQLGDGTQLPESNAILYYLADGTDWFPQARLARAAVLAWMFWEQNQHEGVIAVRAAILNYKHRAAEHTPERLETLLQNGNAILQQMEDRLSDHEWLAIDTPSIADICLYAYTHSADSRGGYDMAPFPAINAWLERISKLPGYVTLDNIPE